LGRVVKRIFHFTKWGKDGSLFPFAIIEQRKFDEAISWTTSAIQIISL